jgi:hypothetical protein
VVNVLKVESGQPDIDVRKNESCHLPLWELKAAVKLLVGRMDRLTSGWHERLVEAEPFL